MSSRERRADVIVVGAGVQGAALAFHLAGRGVDVLVLDRGSWDSGSTRRASGFVRMHYDLASEAALAWAAFPYFEHWDELVGVGDCGFVPTGFVQLVAPELADALRANVAMQQALGIETEVIGAADLARLVPGIVTEDVVAAAWERRSGYADPGATATGLMEAAVRRGARLESGRRVTAVATLGDKVVGVDGDAGRYEAPVVVNAAGPWAAALARTVGLEIPVRVWRHDTFYLARPAGRDERFPIVLDHARQVYFRPDGPDQVLAGLETANELGGSPDRPFTEIGPRDVDELRARLGSRLPWMADATLRLAHGGQDGMTPDQRAIIDRAGPDGHYLLCGFSGSGFKTAPATALGMAELILDGASRSVDVSPYRLERFAKGELLIGDHPYPDLWQ
jgi:glycine/D-amino acid oxidase-like deaminating enzyme